VQETGSNFIPGPVLIALVVTGDNIYSEHMSMMARDRAGTGDSPPKSPINFFRRGPAPHPMEAGRESAFPKCGKARRKIVVSRKEFQK